MARDEALMTRVGLGQSQPAPESRSATRPKN